MKITFDLYDNLLEHLLMIPNTNKGHYPNSKKMQEYITKDLEFFLPYLIWLSETAGKPETKDDEEGRKIIQEILMNELEFEDGTGDGNG